MDTDRNLTNHQNESIEASTSFSEIPTTPSIPAIDVPPLDTSQIALSCIAISSICAVSFLIRELRLLVKAIDKD